jgi:cell division control protein 24
VQKEVRPHDSTPSNKLSLRNIKARLGSTGSRAALKSRLLRIPDEEIDVEDESEWDIQSASSSDNDWGNPPADQCWPFLYLFHELSVQYLLDHPNRNSLRLFSTNLANISGVSRPRYAQYTIYLFERILLCCRELNPNKSKDKLMGGQKDKKDKKDKKRESNKNAKLQLKGRIFMTNVTEVLSLAKQGSTNPTLCPVLL